jgi:hypothetical protein
MTNGPVFIGSFRSAWAFTPQTEPHQSPWSTVASWSDQRAEAQKWFRHLRRLILARPKPRKTISHPRIVTDSGTAAMPRSCVEFARS